MIVSFLAYLRPEMKFAGIDALKAQIAADGQTARKLLKTAPAAPPPLV